MRYQKSIVGKWFLRKMCFDHLRWMAQGFLTETTSRSKYCAKRKGFHHHIATMMVQKSIHPSIHFIHPPIIFCCPRNHPNSAKCSAGSKCGEPSVPSSTTERSEEPSPRTDAGPMPDRCRTDAVDAVKMAWWWWKIFNQPPPQKNSGGCSPIFYVGLVKKIGCSPFFDWVHPFEIFLGGRHLPSFMTHIGDSLGIFQLQSVVENLR